MPRGGARPNAGPKRSTKHRAKCPKCSKKEIFAGEFQFFLGGHFFCSESCIGKFGRGVTPARGGARAGAGRPIGSLNKKRFVCICGKAEKVSGEFRFQNWRHRFCSEACQDATIPVTTPICFLCKAAKVGLSVGPAGRLICNDCRPPGRGLDPSLPEDVRALTASITNTYRLRKEGESFFRKSYVMAANIAIEPCRCGNAAAFITCWSVPRLNIPGISFLCLDCFDAYVRLAAEEENIIAAQTLLERIKERLHVH